MTKSSIGHNDDFSPSREEKLQLVERTSESIRDEESFFDHPSVTTKSVNNDSNQDYIRQEEWARSIGGNVYELFLLFNLDL